MRRVDKENMLQSEIDLIKDFVDRQLDRHDADFYIKQNKEILLGISEVVEEEVDIPALGSAERAFEAYSVAVEGLQAEVAQKTPKTLKIERVNELVSAAEAELKKAQDAVASDEAVLAPGEDEDDQELGELIQRWNSNISELVDVVKAEQAILKNTAKLVSIYEDSLSLLGGK